MSEKSKVEKMGIDKLIELEDDIQKEKDKEFKQKYLEKTNGSEATSLLEGLDEIKNKNEVIAALVKDLYSKVLTDCILERKTNYWND